MTSWQKRARLGVAIFGLVFAAIVYSAVGERQPAPPAAAIQRKDPKALAEMEAAALQRLTGTEQDFDIKFERSVTYDDQSTRQFNVVITVKNKNGRDFVISAREGYAGKDQVELQLKGDVKAVASDGFELTTGEATFDSKTGIARAPGAVVFKKGRMSGSGVGMTYDQGEEVLRFEEQSRVTTTNESGATALDFSGGTTTLDRLQHVLSLERTVHVLRGSQLIDSDRATARLSADNEIVTYIELRGSARVTGGGQSIDSMSARDIDLDYTEDGQVLERVVLNGSGAIVMMATGGASGRQLLGESLDLLLAPDGSLTRATGHIGVRLDLPSTEGSPLRSIQATSLDATGRPGEGLTEATFRSEACGTGAARVQCVEYREEEGSAPPRIARSRRLVTSLAQDALTNAVFTGVVTFEEQGLNASGAEVRYQPDKDTLRLTGSDAGGGPRVADERVIIDAQTIDVALGERRMAASGGVKTTLQPQKPATAATRTAPDDSPARLPGLLEQGKPVNVDANALDYQGSTGHAVYTGAALLRQGDTAIRADAITMDRERGDLVAIGTARSRLLLDNGVSEGRAHEIRYDDQRRVVTYSMAPTGGRGIASTRGSDVAPTGDRGIAPTGGSATAPTDGRGTAPTGEGIAPTTARVIPPALNVQLKGPDGDVTAQKVEIVLAKEGNRIERLDAYTAVSVTVAARTATGARLTFHAADGKYEMKGSPATPVRIVDRVRANSCHETTGQTLIFFKGTAAIAVGGGDTIRSQLKKTDVPCTPPPSR